MYVPWLFRLNDPRPEGERAFDTDPSMIGQTIRLNSNPYTVIGVAPRGFMGPLLGMATDVWVPTALQPEVDPASAALRRSRGHSGRFDCVIVE